MDSYIRDIVRECKVHEKKAELIRNKKTMFELDRYMAKLTFDREVGLYAFNIDKYYDLEEDRKKNKKELELIASKLLELERLDKVLEYKKAREQFEILGYYKDEYFKSVNIYLRNALTEYKDPFVYIAQSNGFKNIISKENNEEVFGTVIYPIYDMKSIRDFRHFYNKTSFHYLEELSEDYSFDVEGKKLGKILVKKF
ncbi:MAG: hypothetical protein IKR57_00885 [Bacilli bacterium]|nr:hypothetical protein [Bacilli bacterium]